MAVPVVYRKSRENVLATYDYIDIASGTGYINFYAGKVGIGGSLSGAILSNIAFYSNPKSTAGTEINGTFIKRVDIDFDVLINKPFTFKGNAIVTIPFVLSDNSAGSWTHGWVAGAVKKVSGGSEVEIGWTSGATLQIGAAVTSGNVETIKVIIPQTIFKKGDYLRLTTEGWVAAGGGGGGTIAIWHDPKDRTTSVTQTPSSILNVQIPVKLNL